jgi:hypothetical protein
MKLSFKNEEKITFSDKQKLRKFIVSSPDLQQILEEILWRERKLYKLATQSYIKKEHQRSNW